MSNTASVPTTQDVVNGFFQSAGKLDETATASYFSEKPDFYITSSPLMPWKGRRKLNEKK
jgi:hypothetical protein